jgi:long-chain fatty acid transport protein
MKLKKLIGVMAVAGFALPGAALATNGYFSHGYGLKAKGMAGAATAMTEDTMGGANNPASMVWVGNRLDVGIDWFSPKRSAKREGSPAGVNFSEDSGSNNFYVPEFGYNHMMSTDMSLGITVYGNGGMNSDYHNGTNTNCTALGGSATSNPLCGVGELGVNLEQLIIAPTLAYKVNASNSIGVSPLFGYQHFRANGLQAFGAISTDATNLTNKGHDQARGWGVRVGWLGKMSDSLTLGAAYSSKISMNKFDKYKGLFAEQGDFDIPENYNIGIAFKATPDLTVAVDFQHISYGDVRAIANPSVAPSTFMGNNDGAGFGWSDVDVWKIGLEYQYSKDLTLRAGYNHGDNPIQSRDVTFNILAPGVVQDHYTLGMTYNLDKASEITVSYMHAQEKSVSGTPNPTYFPVGGTETIKMYQNSLGVAYGMKF